MGDTISAREDAVGCAFAAWRAEEDTWLTLDRVSHRWRLLVPVGAAILPATLVTLPAWMRVGTVPVPICAWVTTEEAILGALDAARPVTERPDPWMPANLGTQGRDGR